MDQETLFTSTKWPILQALSQGKKSPFELSALCKTSVANISQQLRLLELAGLITVERIPNRDKGQPRILYALSGNHAFLLACMPGLAEKKLIKLNSLQKVSLAIWLTVDQSKQYFLEKTIWNLEQYFPRLQAIYFDPKISNSLSLTIISDDAEVRKKLVPYTIEYEGVTASITFIIKKQSEFKHNKTLCTLYERS